MKISNDILIYELIKFTYNINSEAKIEIFRLKNAFTKLLEIIEENHHYYLSINFDNTLTEFLKEFNEYFTTSIDNKFLIIKNPDFNAIEEIILSNHKLTNLDKKISEFIQSMDIYKILNIKVKLSDIKDYLQLNIELLKLYQKLAWNEFTNEYNHQTIIDIKKLKKIIENKFNQIDTQTSTKLKASLNSYNFLYSKTLEDPNNFEPWYIILFTNTSKKNESLWKSLGYYYIEYLNDTTITNSPLELEANTLNTNDQDNISCDIDLFLTYYIVELTNYLKNVQNKITKENLTIKKYLLLSLPEVENLSSYYLENQTIAGFDIDHISKNWLTEKSFDSFVSHAFECTSFDYTDEELNEKQYLESKIITNALFIKCYLDLSLNENTKSQIIKLITTSKFYKNPNYKITTNLIDEIIFNQKEELKR